MTDLDLVLVLLAAVALLASIGRRAAIPGPIVFALGGMALAFFPQLPVVALPPRLVLTVFLPPLIYSASLDTSWTEVKRDARPILLLAVGLVLVTMCAVAYVAHAVIPGFSWPAAFMLGAIVSPPDAVAAKAVADTLKLPHRLIAVLEGEGLFNDATALVAFQITSAIAFTGATFKPTSTAVQFIYAAFVAIVIGVAIGWLSRFVLSRLNDPAAENTLTLLMPFAAYLPAEHAGASGVLAVLSLSLYLSRFGSIMTSSIGRLQGIVLWSMIDFILTGLSFVLVGLQLPQIVQQLSDESGRQLLFVTAMITLTVLIVRPIWIFSTSWFANLRQRHKDQDEPTNPKELTIMSWAGMRGVVSLAIALSIPNTTASGAPFHERNIILFITFVVIVVTLVGQGLTLPILIRSLRVGTADSAASIAQITAQKNIIQAGVNALEQLAQSEGYAAPSVAHARELYSSRLLQIDHQLHSVHAPDAPAAPEIDASAESKRLIESLLAIEESELQKLRREGKIENAVARRMQSNLDLLRLSLR